MKRNYELKTNHYGNVTAIKSIPNGWITVTQKHEELKAAKIPHYQALIGFDSFRNKWNHQKYHIPITTYIIPKTYKSVLTKYLKKQKN